MSGEHMIFALWRNSAGKRFWYLDADYVTETEPPAILALVNDRRDELEAVGLGPRSWWIFWPCTDCGAPPLAQCRSQGRRPSR